MRFAAALLAVSTALTGCAGFTIGPTDSTAQVYSSPEKDDSDFVLPLVLGATALIVVVALAVRADDDSDHTDKIGTGTAQPAAEAEMPARFAGAPDPDHIERMFVQGHALARAGRCDGVHAIGRNVMKLSYADGVRYTRDPALAACYTPFATPPPASR